MISTEISGCATEMPTIELPVTFIFGLLLIYTALFAIILAENININSDTQNKDINKLIN